jgi:hypothetical protein
MNRIIIIGNGFDLAHNLKTGYKDFINDYWATVEEGVYDQYWRMLDQQYGGAKHPLNDYEDKFVKIEKRYDKTGVNKVCSSYKEDSPLWKLHTLINEHNNDPSSNVTVHLTFKNHFFEHISHQCSLVNWVDIENEYYKALKELLQEENYQKQNESIHTLNKEFDDVKGLLEKYLTRITENTELKQHQSIHNVFSSFIEFDEVATCKQTAFINSIFSNTDIYHDFTIDYSEDPAYSECLTKDEQRRYFINKNFKYDNFKKNHLAPYTLLLNFNYTQTAEKLYAENCFNEIINIHGELNNENNPIIFGYGDELDNDYERIERLQNNDFLENIKSIRYHKTKNYRSLLEFIALGPYQVFIMGHSCGNSDRTLLNTLFEHDNCLSIKVFYRQYKDGTDNYIDLIKNISRNFNNKPNMRDIVVNRENCSPLVPVKKEVAE